MQKFIVLPLNSYQEGREGPRAKCWFVQWGSAPKHPVFQRFTKSTVQEGLFLRLGDHKTFRMCSDSSFSPDKTGFSSITTLSLTKGLEKSLCDFNGTIFVQCENPVVNHAKLSCHLPCNVEMLFLSIIFFSIFCSFHSRVCCIFFQDQSGLSLISPYSSLEARCILHVMAEAVTVGKEASQKTLCVH